MRNVLEQILLEEEQISIEKLELSGLNDSELAKALNKIKEDRRNLAKEVNFQL